MISKKYKIGKLMLGAALFTFNFSFFTSCTGDLDTVPIDKDDLVSSVVFGSEIGAYEESLAKIYAGLVIGGMTLAFPTSIISLGLHPLLG